MYNQEEVIVIDYKTGAKKEKDSSQVREYGHWISTIFERPVLAFLVYLDFTAQKQVDIVEVPLR